MKLQIAADADNKNILRIAVSSGKTHDFKMLKESRLILPDDTLFVLDKAYQGIFEIHPMSLIPIKATKNHKLTPEEKAFNSFVSKLRIFIEHINRYIKRFRILSSRYRNKGNTAYIPFFKMGYRKTPGKNAESIDLCSIFVTKTH